MLPRGIVSCKEVSALNVFGNWKAGKLERAGGDINVLDKVFTYGSGELFLR